MISISGAAAATFRGGRTPALNHLRSVIRFKTSNKEVLV
jgi:hypothetical protein